VEIGRYSGRVPSLGEYPEEANYYPLRSQVDDAPVPLTHYLWVIKRQKWRIIGFVFLAVAGALIYSLQQTPIYESTAILELDNQAQLFEIGEGGVRLESRNWDMVVETQIQMMDSTEIARQVIRELQLDRHPDFNPALRRRGGTVRAATPETGVEAELPPELPGLRISRRPDTYLLEVRYRSSNPDLAAAIANAAARAFVQNGFLSQFQNATELTKWLNRQLEEMKAKLERSQQALRNFERDHNVINPEDRSNILNLQLQSLQGEMTTAQAERLRKQSEFQAASSGDLDALAISGQGEPIVRLAERMESLEVQLAEAGVQYGPNHPAYKRLESQVARARQSLEAARKKVLNRLEADYRQAAARENALVQALSAAKAEVDRLGIWTVEYGILKREVESQSKLYEELLKKVNEASINASIKATNLRLVSLATPNEDPVAPVIRLNLLLAFLVSTTLAVGIALAADYLDRTLRSTEQVEQWLNVPVLATVPRVAGKKAPLPVLPAPREPSETAGKALSKADTPFLEALGMLRTSLLLSAPAGDMRTILVASAAPAEGKSTMACGLALALAQQLESGGQILLVDSDLRRPNIHNIFGLPNRVGLATILEGQSKLEECLHASETAPGLAVLTAGPSHRYSGELLTMHMAKFLEEVRQEYRYVVIDSAPLLVCADTTILSTMADGVVVVARAGDTPRDAVAAALRQLRRVRANVLGLVLNQIRLPDLHGYGQYYKTYYQSSPTRDEV
jgi:capsular exopolysaccharide synthesis family protein